MKGNQFLTPRMLQIIRDDLLKKLIRSMNNLGHMELIASPMSNDSRFLHACDVVLAEIDRLFPGDHESYIDEDVKPCGERRFFIASRDTTDETLRAQTEGMFPDGVHPKRFRRDMDIPYGSIVPLSRMRTSKSLAWVRCVYAFSIPEGKTIYLFDVEYTV